MKHKRLNHVCIILFVLVVFTLLTTVGIVSGQETSPLPLSEAGPFAVGTRAMNVTDANRNARKITFTIWYPAVEGVKDAAPDLSGAPYPVVVYAHGWGGAARDLNHVTTHLASYGFVVIAANHPAIADSFMVDRPLDILFVIDQLANQPEGDLQGLMNWEQLGVMGWSLGGATAMQFGGVRFDWPATREVGCTYHPQPSVCLTDAFNEAMLARLEKNGTRDENGLAHSV